MLAQPAEQPRILERGAARDREVAVVNERVELGYRPRRRDRGVAMQSCERVDAQVAVDQHEPIVLGDHHHGHLLPDLGERADQPASTSTVDDPQIAMAQVELVQIDLHPATLPVSAARVDLVLHRPAGKSNDSVNDLRHFLAYLVLHEQTHLPDYSRNDHTSLDAHLVLHHVPRQSGGRWPGSRGRRRLARLCLRDCDRLAPPPITIVVAICGAPPLVGAAVALALTLLPIARPLSLAYARISQEPAAADRARALLSHSADQDRLPTPPTIGGSLFTSDPGSILASAAEGTYSRLLMRFARADVLVLDDWAMAPITDPERRDLLEVLEDRYGTRSTIVTSQVPPQKWHQHISEPTHADAICDRLIHNAHKLVLKGPSRRRPEDETEK